MKYNLADIKIGDEVYFKSTNVQSNHELYWKVIDKIDGTTLLIVQLNEMGYSDLRHTIDIGEVVYHNSL